MASRRSVGKVDRGSIVGRQPLRKISERSTNGGKVIPFDAPTMSATQAKTSRRPRTCSWNGFEATSLRRRSPPRPASTFAAADGSCSQQGGIVSRPCRRGDSIRRIQGRVALPSRFEQARFAPRVLSSPKDSGRDSSSPTEARPVIRTKGGKNFFCARWAGVRRTRRASSSGGPVRTICRDGIRASRQCSRGSCRTCRKKELSRRSHFVMGALVYTLPTPTAPRLIASHQPARYA